MSWQTAKLCDVCEIVSGSTPKTAQKEYWDGDIYWATPKDLSGLNHKVIKKTGRKITQAGLASCSAKVLPKNSVLFSSRAPIGLVAVNDVAMATNQGFKSFVPHANVLSPHYLYWWLKTNRTHLNRLGVGATFKEVSKSIIERVEIPLPSLAEQTRIAEILDKADEIKAKREQAIAKLEELAQRTFVEIFGDVRLNPKGWEKVTLEQIATKITDGEHLTPRRTNEGIKLLSARNVQDGYLSFDDVDYVDKVEYERISKRCKPEYDDILISCSGSIGRVALIKIREPLALVRSAALVKPDITRVNPTYLEHYLRSSYMKAEMLSKAKSSSQANLFQAPIRALIIGLPPLHLQNEFEKFINKQRVQKSKMQTGYKVLTELIVSLQQKAFTTGFNA